MAGSAVLGIVVALVVTGCAAPDYRIATEPGPASFAEFAEVAAFGDPVRIDLVDGSRIDGMVVDVDAEQLRIDPATKGISGYVTLRPEQVAAIRYRNGPPTILMVGAAAGAGAILFAAFGESPTIERR